MTDYNPYVVIGMVAADKAHGALSLALEMAKKSYPHLVETFKFALDMYEENSLTFIGSQNLPKNLKPAYSKKYSKKK